MNNLDNPNFKIIKEIADQLAYSICLNLIEARQKKMNLESHSRFQIMISCVFSSYVFLFWPYACLLIS